VANKVDFIIGAEDENFRQTFKRITETLKRPEVILAGLATVSGAGTAALALMTAQLAKTADALGKLAGRINANAEGLSELQFVAERSGVAIEALNIGLQRQVRRISEAAKGTGEAKDAIKELGLEAKQLNKLKADEQFLEIAKAIDKVQEPADRVRLAFKLWDSEGVKLLQTLDNGIEGIDQMREQARQLGIVISEETTEAAKEFEDSLTNLKNVLPGFRNRLTKDLLEPFANLFSLLTDVVTTDNAVTYWAERWGEGVGIIVDYFTDGARNILDSQRSITDGVDKVRKKLETPVNVDINTSEVDKKLDDLRALINDTFPEDDPNIIRNFATAQKDAAALESEVQNIRDRIKELNSGQIDINTNDVRQEIRDLQFALQEIREEQAVIAEPRLRLDAILKDLDDIEENFDPIEKNLQEPKTLSIDTSQADQSLSALKTRLDEIPQITTKTVRVNFELTGYTEYDSGTVEGLQESIATDLNRKASPIGGGLVRGGLSGESTL